MSRCMGRLVVAAALAMGPAMASPAADAARAPADAWPVARGCIEGTGASAATLRLPLVEAWRREFEGTAFGTVPVIADGVAYVGDLDGTFHAVSLADLQGRGCRLPVGGRGRPRGRRPSRGGGRRRGPRAGLRRRLG